MLSKEERERETDRYKFQSNCKALNPPQINNETQPCCLNRLLKMTSLFIYVYNMQQVMCFPYRGSHFTIWLAG